MAMQETPKAIAAAWTRQDLQAVLKVSGRTIDRLVERGRLPAPFYLGRCCRWWPQQVLACLGANIANIGVEERK